MSLASHLAEQYSTLYPSRAPFGEPIHSSQLAICGPMSFAPQMHGNFSSQPSFSDPSLMSMESTMGISVSTAEKIAMLQAKLSKKLGPEYVSQRPGPGGGPKLTYVEGWKIINLANEVFGFNNWSSNVVNLSTDFMDYDEQSKRCTVGISAIVRVTLRDGVYHEDVGYGVSENAKGKGAAFDKAKKEAVTDGVKRALRNFGNLLGNCLYDKQYTQEVVKIKVPLPKFNKDDLHRRAEFQEGPSTSSAAPAPAPALQASTLSTKAAQPQTPLPVLPKAIGVMGNAPINKTASNAFPARVLANNMTPIRKGISSGLATPAQTPVMLNGKPLAAAQMHIASNVNQQPPGSRVQPTPLQSTHAPINAPVKIDSRPSSGTDVSDAYSFNIDDEELLKLDLDSGGGYHDFEAETGRPLENKQVSCTGSGTDRLSNQNVGNKINPVQTKASSSNLSGVNHARFIAPPKLGLEPQHPELANQSDDDIARQITLLRQKKNAEKVAEANPSLLDQRNQGVDQQTNQVQSSRPPIRQNPSVIRTTVTASIKEQGSVPSPAHTSAVATPDQTKGSVNGRGPPISNKPRAPSMGGFNFPSGMTPSQQAGTKRPVSVLAPQLPGQQNVRGGMGLSTANAGQNGQNRSITVRRPLVPLDLDEGGDVKRMRI